jgi:hypothetical protein
LDHDFPIKEPGKVAPYGINDINSDSGGSNGTRVRLWKKQL